MNVRIAIVGLVLALSVGVQAQEAKPPATLQAAITAARKVVQNARAAVLATEQGKALVDAENALRAVEALQPVEPKPSAK